MPDVPEPVGSKIDFPAVTNIAIAGGASSGGVAVVGAFIVNIFTLQTRAWLGAGAQVNQENPAGGTGQDVTVSASDAITVVDVAGALGLSKDSASVGITVVVEISNSDVRAWIADGAAVRAGGSVTIEAISAEDWFVLAIAGAVSGGNAAISGAVLVVVANQGGSDPQTLASIGSALVDAVGDIDRPRP